MRRPVAALVLLALVAACGPTAAPGSTSNPSSTSPPTTHPAHHGTPAPFVAVDVAVAAGPHGDQIVDGEGRSLYLFTLDDERTSTCEDACSELWPPFLGDPVAGDGVDEALLGNAERSDGSIQVTYGGHPLYYYAEDAAPGDAGGHGFNDVWFLVSPTGDPLT